jgi:signal transduction histidine kinase
MSGVARRGGRIAQLAFRPHLPRRTVRVRLTLLYGGLFLLSGAALVATTYVLFERATEYTAPRLPQIPHTPTIQRLNPKPPFGQPGPALANVQYQLNQDRQQLIHAVSKGGFGPPVLQRLPQLAEDQHRLAQDQHQLARAVDQLAAAVHQMSRSGSVEAAQRTADSHELLVDSGIALAIVAMLALLAGWLVAGRMLRPIRTITRRAQRISSANLKERLALDGPQDELKELGDTLDGLFGRLDGAFEAQRQFVANASHELRAPLTRQRALIQVALADPRASLASLRQAHERVLVSERHLEQMIDGLLALTRGQAGLERREHLDLATLTSEAALARKSQLAVGEVELRASLTTAPTAGDPRLIERLIANLLENAIRHNVSGGHVEVATGTRDGHAFITIANTGPAVPGEEIPRLFQPFQRLRRTRTEHASGHGLGLSIVQAIADAHGATLTARERPAGGLTIEVFFPPPVGSGPAMTPGAPRLNGGSTRELSEAVNGGGD